jgi:lipopolysaccharide/colanic/teichoic acid biosynthesis glycosyltransferase
VGLGSIDRDVQNAASEVAAQPASAESPRLIVSNHATEGATALARPDTQRADTRRADRQSDVAHISAARPIIRLTTPFATDTRTVTLYERFLKPVIDKALAFVLLIVLSPVLFVVGVMVAKSLGRPIVLRQRRVGKNEQRFVLHKFRTMHPDRRSPGNEYDGHDRRITHKHPDDPRLTPVGQTLRKWSLDELPQLWDVLKGTLSIVGPRPELESIVANYEPWQHARHAVRPGLTGLWQIKARGDGEMHEHTDLDIEYVQKITLRGDLKIMLLTLPAILTRKGY